MKKYFFILLLLVLALPAFAQKHKLIYYGVLDSSLNGNGYSITNLTNVSASSFVGNGASLTNLTASSLVGQVPTASLSNGTNLLLGGGGIAVTRLGSTNVVAGNVLAAGSGVTIIQSTNATDGTVTNTVFTSGTNAYPQDVRFSTAYVTNVLTVNGTINAPSFQTTAGGTAILSGANFTVINGTSVFASGGVETARFQGGYATLGQYVKVDPDGRLHAGDETWSIGNDGSFTNLNASISGDGVFTGNGGGLTNIQATGGTTNFSGIQFTNSTTRWKIVTSGDSLQLINTNGFGLLVNSNGAVSLLNLIWGDGAQGALNTDGSITTLNASIDAAGNIVGASISTGGGDINLGGGNINSCTTITANTVTAGVLNGNGIGITNLNATNLVGTIPAGHFTAGSTNLAGKLYVVADDGIGHTNHYATFNASALTNLNASQLASGTVPLALLPAAVVTNNQTGVTLSGTLSGNGAGLTNLNSTNLNLVPGVNITFTTNGGNSITIASTGSGGSSGTIYTNTNPSQFGTNATGQLQITNGATLTNANLTTPTISAGTTYGPTNGGNLLNIPAANLTGSIADARLSANVPLLNTNNSFTKINTFTISDTTLAPISSTNTVASSFVSVFVGACPNITSGQSAFFQLGKNSTAGNAVSPSFEYFSNNSPSNAYNISFYAGNPVFTALNNGNVGIGITNPAALMDVNGTARIPTNTAAIAVNQGLVTAALGYASSRSNLVAPTSITFPATTAPWTNTLNCNIALYIDNTGVTGTSISLDGGIIFSGLANDVTIMLQPGEYFSEAYTVGTPAAKLKPF